MAVNLTEDRSLFESDIVAEREKAAERYDENHLEEQKDAAFNQVNKGWRKSKAELVPSGEGLRGFSEDFDADSIKAFEGRRKGQAEKLVSDIKDRIQKVVSNSIDASSKHTESYTSGNAKLDRMIMTAGTAKNKTIESIFQSGKAAEASLLMSQMHKGFLETIKGEVLAEWEEHMMIQRAMVEDIDQSELFGWKGKRITESIGASVGGLGGGLAMGMYVGGAVLTSSAALGGIGLGLAAAKGGIEAGDKLQKKWKKWPYKRLDNFSLHFTAKLEATFSKLNDRVQNVETIAAEAANRTAGRVRRQLNGASEEDRNKMMQELAILAKEGDRKPDMKVFDLGNINEVTFYEAFRVDETANEDRRFTSELLKTLQNVDSFKQAYELTNRTVELAGKHQNAIKEAFDTSFPNSYANLKKTPSFTNIEPHKEAVSDKDLIVVIEKEIKAKGEDPSDFFDDELKQGNMMTDSLKLQTYLREMFLGMGLDGFSLNAKAKILRWFKDKDETYDVAEVDYSRGAEFLNTLKKREGVLGLAGQCLMKLDNKDIDEIPNVAQQLFMALPEAQSQWESIKDDVPGDEANDKSLKGSITAMLAYCESKPFNQDLRDYLDDIRKYKEEKQKLEEKQRQIQANMKSANNTKGFFPSSYGSADEYKKALAEELIENMKDENQPTLEDFDKTKRSSMRKKLSGFNLVQPSLIEKVEANERASQDNHKLRNRLQRYFIDQHEKELAPKVLKELADRDPFDKFKNLVPGTPIQVDYNEFDALNSIEIPSDLNPKETRTFTITKASGNKDGIQLQSGESDPDKRITIDIVRAAVTQEDARKGQIFKNAMVSHGTKTPGTMAVVWNMNLAS